ncbi:MAG TPA: CDP-alcohol phosphatidyltransferase family protein [Actinomycetota bacterium]|nr:CDP-alcohol phosphatidyltransferase family protein [Actinomycetota bacterium]
MSPFEADARGAKKRDYWFTVLLTDPLAVPLTNFLARRRLLTPNQVTIVSLLLGLSVGVFFATAQRWGLVAGGIAFYLAFVTDCVDGKLARATGITSAKGQALDALADGGRRASAIFGLAAYVYGNQVTVARTGEAVQLTRTHVGDSFDLFHLMVVIVYAVLAYYFLEISGAEKGEPAGGVRGRWSQTLARYRLLPNPGMPDVQAIVFIFGPITGFVIEALLVGIAMVTVAILLTVRRRLR